MICLFSTYHVSYEVFRSADKLEYLAYNIRIYGWLFFPIESFPLFIS